MIGCAVEGLQQGNWGVEWGDELSEKFKDSEGGEEQNTPKNCADDVGGCLCPYASYQKP
jgi:hypothetical protein